MAQSSPSSDGTITLSPQHPRATIPRGIFNALDMRVGTVSDVKANLRVKQAALQIKVNFGSGFDDLLQSSAQLTENYGQCLPESSLLNSQIVAVTNFPARRVGIMSTFLILAVVPLPREEFYTTVIVPKSPVSDGAKVSLLNHSEPASLARLSQIDYLESFAKLDIRVGTVTDTHEKTIDFGDDDKEFHYSGDYELFEQGLQILRVVNLSEGTEDDNFLGVTNEFGKKIPLTLERYIPNGRPLA